MPEIETAEVETSGIDMAAAVERMGAELFPDPTTEQTDDSETDDAPADVPTPLPVEAAAPSPTTPTLRPVPKSWAKDVHEVWGKIDPKAQEYIAKREKDFLDGLEQYKQKAQYGDTLQQVLAPYHPILQQKGLDAPRAVADLMDAYVRLTQGTPESRWQAYQKIRENFGLQDPTNGQPVTPVDPQVQSLKQQFEQLQQGLVAQQQAALQEAKAKVDQEVDAFIADTTAHPYFNEVAQDMIDLMNAKKGLSLQEAYDKAVKMNEVTAEKEKARILTEAEAKWKENARLEALPKQKAKGVNIKSRDTQRTPTEPLGSMDNTLRETFRSIKSR